jgi:hypothetical protein
MNADTVPSNAEGLTADKNKNLKLTDLHARMFYKFLLHMYLAQIVILSETK